MTHERNFQSLTPTSRLTLAEMEQRITLSSPQPREGFQQELAQRLRAAFEQHKSPTPDLISIPSRRYRQRSVRTAATLIAVLILGIGVVVALGTILQRFLDHDAGLKAVFEQGLGHEIGINQSHEGFTVTLEWAYADDNRLVLAYVIGGLPGTPYTNLASDAYTLTLRDTGEEIPFYQGMGALIDQNGEAIGWGAPPEPLPVSDRCLRIDTYDLGAIDVGDRQTLDLTFEMTPYGITLQQRTLMPPDQFDAMKEGPEAPFTFDFSIPLVDGRRTLDTPLRATDQDITVILQRVNVTPSQAHAIVCFLPPDPARQWTAIPNLTTSQGAVAGGGGAQPFMDGDLTCTDFTYFAGMLDYTGEWRLEVTELVGFGSGGGDDQQRIAGSWVFNFAVP